MKIRLLGIIIAAALTTIIAGCGTVDVTKTGKGYHQPTDPNKIQILKTYPPGRNFEELGEVTVLNFAATDIAKMHNAIRAKAAPLGADAVIITGENIIPGFGGYKRTATGAAIKFTD